MAHERQLMRPGAVIFLEGREPRHPVRRQGPRKINSDQEAVRGPTLKSPNKDDATPERRKTRPKTTEAAKTSRTTKAKWLMQKYTKTPILKKPNRLTQKMEQRPIG